MVDCTTNPTSLKKHFKHYILFMSDILETESNAVITAKKTFNQFAKFYGFEVLVYQSDFNKLY